MHGRTPICTSNNWCLLLFASNLTDVEGDEDDKDAIMSKGIYTVRHQVVSQLL